jgi:hypothetical protein
MPQQFCLSKPAVSPRAPHWTNKPTIQPLLLCLSLSLSLSLSAGFCRYRNDQPPARYQTDLQKDVRKESGNEQGMNVGTRPMI